MHKCMRCGRELKTIGEIENGCTCGSKVFLYTKNKEDAAHPSQNHDSPETKSREQGPITPENLASAAYNRFMEQIEEIDAKLATNASLGGANGKQASIESQIPQGNGNHTGKGMHTSKGIHAGEGIASPNGNHAHHETAASVASQREQNSRKLEAAITTEMAKKSIDAPVMLELENIHMLEKGVFNIDLKSLLRDPVVLKDTNGVYYIKLPE